MPAILLLKLIGDIAEPEQMAAFGFTAEVVRFGLTVTVILFTHPPALEAMA